MGAHISLRMMWEQVVGLLLWALGRMQAAGCDAEYERQTLAWRRCHVPELYTADCDAVFENAEPNFISICSRKLFF